ncbi:MAG: DUF294 nucleotidyltransferase-like domain-containing protein, partial [Pseudomonadota bacterium]
MPHHRIPRQREIIDRRELSARIAEFAEQQDGGSRPAIVGALRDALEQGRSELAARLRADPSAGHACVHGHSFLTDQLIRVIHDYVTEHVYPLASPTSAERLAILAVGGYGRAEMAPHSDVDIAFITPIGRAPWCEQVIEAMLYLLWDLGLKVGHSSRTVSDTMRMAKDDLTIRTALLEARLIWGDQALY